VRTTEATLRVGWILFALCMLLPATAAATPRDRFAGTLSLGATVGAGSPRGIAGAFLELRPVRWLGFGGGGGFGGAFGPAVDGEVLLSPVGTRGWALDLGVAFSHNVSWVRGPVAPHHASLPNSTNWLSVEAASEFRPSHGLMVRVGVGHAWLLHPSDFAVATTSELSQLWLQIHGVPGATPYDAVEAAAQGQGFGLWFVHVDIAPTWRL